MYQVLRKKHIREPHSNIPWIEFIEKAFNDIGMTDIWIYEGMGQQTNYVKQTVKTRIKDIFLQNWSAELEAHEYCDTYRSIKKTWGFEKYLTELNYEQRMAVSKFRCRSNYLPITKSRFRLCDFEELQCILCDKFEIGNETHYLINCIFLKI